MLLQGGWTPLYMAAQNGHLAVVEQLLGAGAAVDAANKVGASPTAGCRWVHVVAAGELYCRMVGARKAGGTTAAAAAQMFRQTDTACWSHLPPAAAAAGWLDSPAHGSSEWTPGCGAEAAGCGGCRGCRQQGGALTSSGLQMWHVVIAG
jgi:hypothetical protein